MTPNKRIQIVLPLFVVLLVGIITWQVANSPNEPKLVYQPVAFYAPLGDQSSQSKVAIASQIGTKAMRILGLYTNISPVGVQWSIAVPNSPAMPLWGVRIEATNKLSAQPRKVILSTNMVELTSLPLAANEDGILTWSDGLTLKPEKVYRVVAAYWGQDKLASLRVRFPKMGRLLPPKPQFVTSEWFEVTTKVRE